MGFTQLSFTYPGCREFKNRGGRSRTGTAQTHPGVNFRVQPLALDQLQRELANERANKDASSGKKDTPKVTTDGANVQALQKQLSERDKKIDELSSQLEALKRIDQEMREKVRPIRPPSTVTPPATPEPANP